MVEALTKIKGVEAVVLGGSYARGSASDASDVDLGIYYSEKMPPLINELQNLAKQFDANAVATNFYEWGPWVNGGAWLNTQIGEVDWLYRNLDQVHKVIAEARLGRFIWDFRQQPPYGYFSVMYLADLQQSIPLHDPKGIFAGLKEATKEYPEPLRQAILQEHLWSVEFSNYNAKKLARRGCLYATAGCITRIAAELTQVLFALNKVYFASEKEAFKTIESFPVKPAEYTLRMSEILASPGHGDTLTALNALIREVIALCAPFYTPKYSMES